MPTPGERRALLFLAAIAALGVTVRACTELRGPAPMPIAGDRAALTRQIEAVDSAIAVGGDKRHGRGTQKVPATATRLAPKAPAVAADSPRAPRSRRARAEPSPQAPMENGNNRHGTPPGVTAAERPPYGRRLPRSSTTPPVDLDTAPLDEIAAIPAIGPALARRIVTDRIEHGPFGSINGLERVQGISPSLARRFQPYVTFSLPARLDAAVPPPSMAQKRRVPRGAASRP